MAATHCSSCIQFLLKKGKFVNKLNVTSILEYASTRQYSSEFDTSRDVLKSHAFEHKGKKNELFERSDVQSILKKLTGFDLDIIFKPRHEELDVPKYKVLTDEELKKIEEDNIQEAMKRLKMPPVMKKRKPINIQLEINPDLIEMDEDGSDLIFTDISPSKDATDRAVLVRENESGVLREGSWDERDRMEFMYWPNEGRYHELLPMLQDDQLFNVFDSKRHEDALDLVNLQCSPDSPDYIRVHQRVYDNLDESQNYDLLYSTCHYGGMVYYLICNDKFQTFLTYLIKKERITDAVDLIKLQAIIKAVELKKDGIPLLKQYLVKNKMNNCIELLDHLTDYKTQVIV